MTQDARFAAIDLGSNSFHLIIATVKRDGGYRILSRHRQKVRLADGFNTHLKVSEAAIQRGLECLNGFADMLKNISSDRICCVATATLRKATNRAQILPRFEQALGHSIDIISGDCEAELIYQGATQHLMKSNKAVLVLDIGGASTEVIVGQGTQPQHLVSLDMGCVTWQNRFFRNKTITQETCEQALTAAGDLIQPHADKFVQAGWQHVSGASGTFRALHDMNARHEQLPMSEAWLRDVLARTIELGQVKKLGQLGIRRDRQAVFVGGLCILIALVEHLNIQDVEIADGALREGLLINMLTRPNF